MNEDDLGRGSDIDSFHREVDFLFVSGRSLSFAGFLLKEDMLVT